MQWWVYTFCQSAVTPRRRPIARAWALYEARSSCSKCLTYTFTVYPEIDDFFAIPRLRLPAAIVQFLADPAGEQVFGKYRWTDRTSTP